MKKKCINIFLCVCVMFFASQIIYSQNINITESETHYKNGKKLLENGEILKAVNEFELSIKSNPNNSLSYFEIGLIYLEKTKVKYLDKVPVQFKKVLSLTHDSTSPIFIDSLYYLGLSYAQLGEQDNTISTFKELLKLKLDKSRKNKVLNYIGTSYYYKKNYKEAFYFFKESLEINPDDKIANYNIMNLNKISNIKK